MPLIAEKRASASAMAIGGIHRKSCFLQLSYLVKREVREVLRNKIGLVMRFVVNAVMGLFFAFIFLDIGRKDNEPGGLQGHFGAICNLMISTMFGNAQPLLLQFPLERPIFLREHATNMYGTVPYFLAKTIVEMPLTFLTSLETFLISYWVIGLSGNFIYLVMVGWALGIAAASTALMVGCSVAHAQSAQELAPLLFVPQILFSGIFIPIRLIPEGLQWLQYLCALKYAVNLACVVEFESLPMGRDFLKETQNIDPDKKWLYVAIMVGIFFAFRSLAMINLRRHARFVI